jgi:hypothetical protein
MTAQVPDIIVIAGEELPLFSNPPDSYFNEENPRPAFQSMSTANWRGYVATWEISESALYLVDLKGTISGSGGVNIATIFPDDPERIKADWFSGTLRIPRGKCINYMHLGYGSIYEEDLIIEVENGVVKKREIVDNKKASKERVIWTVTS